MAPARLTPPDSVLTRAASNRAVKILPPALLNHSYRTYRFGRALGELEGLDVDTELLFAAAMLHDTGLVTPPVGADFTLASSRLAREVAENVGLSTAATEVMQTAITMHHNPRVTLDDGEVAYLLSAGAAVDVVGFRAWRLPPDTLTDAVREHPRTGFKTEFVSAFRQEAARDPRGPGQVPAPLRRLRRRHQVRTVRRVTHDARTGRPARRRPGAVAPSHPSPDPGRLRCLTPRTSPTPTHPPIQSSAAPGR